jgi:hypothetical protein
MKSANIDISLGICHFLVPVLKRLARDFQIMLRLASGARVTLLRTIAAVFSVRPWLQIQGIKRLRVMLQCIFGWLALEIRLIPFRCRSREIL